MVVHAIGDFPEAEARAFFEWQLTFSVWEPPPLDDASWARIFEVCGGNAGSLLLVAGEWKGASSLEGGTSPFSRAFFGRRGGRAVTFPRARSAIVPRALSPPCFPAPRAPLPADSAETPLGHHPR